MIKKLHISLFFAFVLFVLMWILFGWNTGNADFENYLGMYESDYSDLKINSLDFGYFYLNQMFGELGYTFMQFRAVLSFFGLSVLFLFIAKWSSSPFISTLIYLIAVFSIDAVQVRNFCGYVIVLFALKFLIDGSTKGRIIYSFFVLISATFHIVMLFYLIFNFIDPIKKLKPKNHILISIGLLIIGTPVLQYIFSALNIDDNGKIENYLEVFSYPALIISVMVLLVNYVVVNYFVNKNSVEIKSGSPLTLVSQVNFTNVVYNINTLFFYLIPLFPIDMTFLRLYRNLFVLNIIFIFNTLKQLDGQITIKDRVILLAYVIIAFGGFIWIYKESTLFAILTNNSFFN